MKPIIALDADGVLVDYHSAYRQAWARAFGVLPGLRDPQAYWALDRWDVHRLAGEELATFRSCFDNHFWSTIPALPGAVEACRSLEAVGYELICVSALEPVYQKARLQNLRDCGFPIERVIATSSVTRGESPKAVALRDLQPVAFVDDFLPYLRGIPQGIHTALILREPNGSPNTGNELTLAHSVHVDLAQFAAWWVER